MSDCKTYKNVLDPWEIVFQQFYELQYISSYVYFVRKKKGCMIFFIVYEVGIPMLFVL